MHENKTQTYWEAAAGGPPTSYPSLAGDARTDVVVVGAGIVGLTAAYELARAGKKVIVLEALRTASQVTARSTAKLTSQHGLIYGRLIRDFGEENARLYARANQDAIEHIAKLVGKERIDCAFERKPAYLYADGIESASDIDDEAMVAAMLGLPARVIKEMPAPVSCTRALCFDDQAQFNPVRYLTGLARAVAATTQLYEMSRVVGVEQDGEVQHVKTEAGHTVTARHVVIATHLPVVPEGKFFAKAFTFSHTVAAAPLPAGCELDGMFITSGQPTYSFRTDNSTGVPHIIAVGPEYKTGEPEGLSQSFADLEEFLRKHFSIAEPAYRWTNEDFRPMDGMPFVGRASGSTPQLYVATGFDAWGITNGVVAARLIANQILQRENPCARLFDATRIKPLAGGAEFVKENLNSAKQFVAERLAPNSSDASSHLPLGEARVLRANGKSIARYRDMDGKLHELSAVCTHMGCIVEWNEVDLTWDCPCHGSRFGHDGAVLHGPATSPLEEPEPSNGESGSP
ncbi:FAD-dependent oxidoreductase [Pusillimonas noertemannii]|uniref:FAD-dependent oxidoreductase n=1 Tax=Pusillimonas noertemannii TaxID=305977 RepID=UPI003340FB06